MSVHSVRSAPLHQPSLDTLVQVLSKSLAENFKEVDCVLSIHSLDQRGYSRLSRSHASALEVSHAGNLWLM